jgi:hypothetical protein
VVAWATGCIHHLRVSPQHDRVIERQAQGELFCQVERHGFAEPIEKRTVAATNERVERRRAVDAETFVTKRRYQPRDRIADGFAAAGPGQSGPRLMSPLGQRVPKSPAPSRIWRIFTKAADLAAIVI